MSHNWNQYFQTMDLVPRSQILDEWRLDHRNSILNLFNDDGKYSNTGLLMGWLICNSMPCSILVLKQSQLSFFFFLVLFFFRVSPSEVVKSGPLWTFFAAQKIELILKKENKTSPEKSESFFALPNLFGKSLEEIQPPCNICQRLPSYC